jgi:hypothetical protein
LLEVLPTAMLEILQFTCWNITHNNVNIGGSVHRGGKQHSLHAEPWLVLAGTTNRALGKSQSKISQPPVVLATGICRFGGGSYGDKHSRVDR